MPFSVGFTTSRAMERAADGIAMAVAAGAKIWFVHPIFEPKRQIAFADAVFFSLAQREKS